MVGGINKMPFLSKVVVRFGLVCFDGLTVIKLNLS